MKFNLKPVVDSLKKIDITRVKNFFQSLGTKVKLVFQKISAAAVAFSRSKAGAVSAKILVSLLIILSLVQVVFGVLIYGFKMDNKATKIVADIMPFPVAVAGSDFVTYSEYKFETGYIHHFYEATEQEIDLKAIDAQILDQLIENKILEAEAAKNNLRITEKDVDETINGIIEQNGGEEKVVKVLDDLYGLELKEFKKLVRTQLLRDKINNNLIARVEARHILIKAERTATAEQIEAVRVKIVGIQDEIKGGLDFAEAAKKYSEDIGSADQGGKLEPFAKGDMVPEFSDKAFSTNVGEISDPVQTDYGWHIIKVESKSGKIAEKFVDWVDSVKKKNLILKFYQG